MHDQSWGPNWINVTNWPEQFWGPRPEGCWVTTMSDAVRIFRDWGDAWAMTGIDGFVARRIPDWDILP